MRDAAAARLPALDVLRGVAVMGILLANLPGFALPEAGYFSPLAVGGAEVGDRIAWALNFVVVEGKMRALFSLLFGASMLLVIERARAFGESAARVHLMRMAWLFVFGCLHLYLFWWGDILAHFALCGAIAFLFIDLPTRGLVLAGGLALLYGFLTSAAGALTIASAGADAAAILASFGAAGPADMATEIDFVRGGFVRAARWRWETAMSPLTYLTYGGADTVGLMLWGMAGLRSGLLTGAWERSRYRRWAIVTIASGVTAYTVMAAVTIARGFDPRLVFLNSIVLSTPFRPLVAIGYACLIILAIRPGGWLTTRIAAAGRAAFTNYLGTTLIMTFVFSGWGLGLFARVGRAELYLFPIGVWALMLLWSKPWLDRYRHGPLEWLWRTLARGRVQPMSVTGPPAT